MEMDTVCTVIVDDQGDMKCILNPEWEIGSEGAAEILAAVMKTLSEIEGLNPLEFQKALMGAIQGG